MESDLTIDVERKLCAILAADIVGYSDHMHRDEVGTFLALKECRNKIDPIISEYGGRTFFTAGDSVVAEFSSAGSCILCARDIQAAINARNNSSHNGPKMLFRIGLNVGDVVINEDDLIGGGVNIAARLEALAEPGGIFFSGSIYDQIAYDASVFDQLNIEAIGLKNLKNIADPVRVFKVVRSEMAQPITAKFANPETQQSSVNGLQIDTPKGRVILSISSDLPIGRKKSNYPNAVSVSDPRVSRIGKQAKINIREDTFLITDLGSSNGTFLNDYSLPPHKPELIKFKEGQCTITVGGSREPPEKGRCQFIVNKVAAAAPVLRISLDQGIMNDAQSGELIKTWPNLLEEMALVWVLGSSRVLIGGDQDCGVLLPNTAIKDSKVAIDMLGNQYLLSSIGPTKAILNGEPLIERTPARPGDTLNVNGVDLTISIFA